MTDLDVNRYLQEKIAVIDLFTYTRYNLWYPTQLAYRDIGQLRDVG